MWAPAAINTYSLCTLGGSGGYGTDPVHVAWYGTNYTVYIPFRLERPNTYSHMAIYNGTVSGNFCLGVYDAAGTRLATTGSTAQSGVFALQTVALTASVRLGPGLFYLAIQFGNATGQAIHMPFTGTNPFRQAALLGVRVEDNPGFPLPATAAWKLPDANTLTGIPIVALLDSSDY